ncbi:choice-of-anchor X domain-containing protein [Myxococcus qinghaiensis]|uniref:choice-of-anchor X domain-containing protein n=1 Tax=Myxococcus qinghaiensis TaxID=2906758 RepID=UPI0020A6FD98|nr:choice-of-anchor X domain-containing protein [Myxococcus qinghaiensis]MCP3164177.1 hypothetical protein [Myxococcus qinghaiensis]
MTKWSSKRALGLKWAGSGVLVLSLCLTGCGGGEALEAPAPVEAQPQAAATEPNPASQPSPVIQSMDVVAQDDVLGSRTRSLVRVRLAQNQQGLFTQVPVVSDTGKPVVLRDQGTDGDEQAGDGVFSGFAEVDLDTLRETQNRITAAQNQQPNEPLTFAVFNNRELVEERPVVALSSSVFRPRVPIPVTPVGLLSDVKPANSLIITHPRVINDPTRTYDPCSNSGNPNGVWTFNHLMTQMASTFVTPSALTEQWLLKWNANQTLNGWTVPARTQVVPRILNPWPKVAGTLDMTKSAFKLVAIFNRLDLGKGEGPVGYGGSSGGGELRFVFAAVDKSAGCVVRPLLVIFEYGVPINGCLNVKSWAQQWMQLSNPLMTLGSPAYNAALEALTQQVVVAGAAPTKPNGNAINQIRTNDFMLDRPWELREFHLFDTGPTPNFLSETTVALTPGDLRNNTTLLRDFVNTNQAAILANTYGVPAIFAGVNFLGANPRVPTPATTFWRATGIVDNTARHKFSLNTCNGCHARETNTFFTHINEAGSLSGFLSTGMVNPLLPFNVTDPVDGTTVRSFFEIRDRAQHLDSTANQSCLTRAFDRRIHAVH